MPTITQDTLSTALTRSGDLWRAGSLKDTTIKGVTFDKPVRLDNAEGVAFDGCKFVGSGKAPGLTLHGGKGVRLTSCEVSGWETGVKVFDVVGLTVAFCNFHHIAFDGLVLGQVSNFLIDGNTFTDWVPFGTKHPDAIQAVRPDARTGPTREGVIRGNLIVVRKAQGIFVPQVEDVVIEGNTVVTDLATAYGAGKSKNVTLRGNVAATNAPSPTIARFDLREAVGLVIEPGNLVRPYGRRAAGV